MASEPYQNCPCGSGKKLKWCCQKVAKYAEKAEQMMESGQTAGALQALDEGLAVEPQSPWLQLMKARILLSLGNHEEADRLMQSILNQRPGNRPILLMRLERELAHGDVAAAAISLQLALDAASAGEAEEILLWFSLMGRALEELGLSFAALQHYRVACQRESIREHVAKDLDNIQGNANLAPWLRDIWSLRPAPASGPGSQRWANAIELALRGRWLRASRLFETLVTELPTNSDAWFNLGLCQASLAQLAPPARALERSVEFDTDSERAVQTLALAMCLDPRESSQVANLVHYVYPIRDQSRLIQRLKEHPRFQVHVLDARKGELGEGIKDEFYLLDKDAVRDASVVTIATLPSIIGFVRNRGKELELELEDSGKDDPRPALLLEAAGDTIDSDGTRAEVGTIPLSVLRMQRLWGLPSHQPPAELWRIRQLLHQHTFLEVWPETPLGWLEEKTPLEAAGLPHMKSRLRTMLLLHEYTTNTSQFDINFDDLRRRLGIDPEPLFGDENTDVDQVSLSRLQYLRIESLSTPQLQKLFARASRLVVPAVVRRSGETLVQRSAECQGFDMARVFRALAELAQMRVDRTAALDIVGAARRWDSQNSQPDPRSWDILEWQVLAHFDAPSVWGPKLAELMQASAGDQNATSQLMMVLIRVGLVGLAPHPTIPDRMLMDTRMLEMILQQYGSGRPGAIDLTPVGGAPGKIWTPGSQAGPAGSPIVLPGQEVPARSQSKLVIPGS